MSESMFCSGQFIVTCLGLSLHRHSNFGAYIIACPVQLLYHYEDPHTTFFCTPQDAGVVKDPRV